MAGWAWDTSSGPMGPLGPLGENGPLTQYAVYYSMYHLLEAFYDANDFP